MTSYADKWSAADMTLRDYFAAQAVNGYLSYKHHNEIPNRVATYAYAVADAMLAVRKQAVDAEEFLAEQGVTLEDREQPD